jgi:ATP-dependent Lon protease
LIEALKICKTRNPVLMLDEIDKLGKSFQGDPSSALLRCWIRAERHLPRHYLDIPFDFPTCFFITTAIPWTPSPAASGPDGGDAPLGYISEEKVEIARRYLVPRAVTDNGLPPRSSRWQAALLAIANGYAREAGVRQMEKRSARSCARSPGGTCGAKCLPP